MSETKKIYTDDPLIKYGTTHIQADRTKHEIDGILAEYEVVDILWHYAPKENSVYVMFKLEETVNEVPVRVSVRVDCPTIWDREKPKGRPPTPERINWNVSMRAMYHFIYTHLNASYAMQSGKAIAFLGYIQGANGKQVKDMILPELKQYHALTEQPTRKVVEAEFTEQPK
jgi:hypothetical protein